MVAFYLNHLSLSGLPYRYASGLRVRIATLLEPSLKLRDVSMGPWQEIDTPTEELHKRTASYTNAQQDLRESPPSVPPQSRGPNPMPQPWRNNCQIPNIVINYQEND